MGIEDEITVITVEAEPVSLIITEEETVHVLTVIEQGPQGIPGPVGSVGATILIYSAGINLSGHRMVVLDDDTMVLYADNTIPAHANKVLGMTVGAAMAGADVTIQSGGELVEPSWNWAMGIPVWLSANGLLTQVVPVSGFSLIIGFPITATKVFIDIKVPIFLI
jgi:hypothetical protein